MSYPDPGQRPSRSTPIPGESSPFTSPLPPGSAGAQRPTDFANGVNAAPPAGNPWGVSQPFPPMGGQMPPQMPGMAPGMPFATGVPFVAPRRRGGFGIWLFLLIFVLPFLGIGAFVYFQVSDAVEKATDIADGSLSGSERESLGLGAGVDSLFDATATPAVVHAFESEIGGIATTRFNQVLLYPDYAFADVQAPLDPTHLDQYSWRSGRVTGPEPQQNVTDLETTLFTSADVNWDAVAALVVAAPGLTNVEEGEVTHVIVSRSRFDPTIVTMDVFVTGPRNSGYVEANATTGTVIATH